jgi:hypothetical protein
MRKVSKGILILATFGLAMEGAVFAGDKDDVSRARVPAKVAGTVSEAKRIDLENADAVKRSSITPGDVDGDGIVTPADGYRILESCGDPEVKLAEPLPDEPMKSNQNERRFIIFEPQGRDPVRIHRSARESGVRDRDADTE